MHGLNASLLGSSITSPQPETAHLSLGNLYGMVQQQALAVSLKGIYGWLLIASIGALLIVLTSYTPVRPFAIFPKWKNLRKIFRREAKFV